MPAAYEIVRLRQKRTTSSKQQNQHVDNEQSTEKYIADVNDTPIQISIKIGNIAILHLLILILQSAILDRSYCTVETIE
jgi:hypothetical protein